MSITRNRRFCGQWNKHIIQDSSIWQFGYYWQNLFTSGQTIHTRMRPKERMVLYSFELTTAWQKMHQFVLNLLFSFELCAYILRFCWGHLICIYDYTLRMMQDFCTIFGFNRFECVQSLIKLQNFSMIFGLSRFQRMQSLNRVQNFSSFNFLKLQHRSGSDKCRSGRKQRIKSLDKKKLVSNAFLTCTTHARG